MKPELLKTVYEKARAKVNLSLDVLGVMRDGYHELDTVMQSLSLHDDVSVTLHESSGNGVLISVPGFSDIPQNEENTAAKAALRFFEELGITNLTAEIAIKKRIPAGAGLGGGSADAAAVLRAMSILCGGCCTYDRLREIGLKVGADVPFCIEGGTVRAGGRGELISPLPDFPECAIVLVKPEFSVSTAELYRKIDDIKIEIRPDTDGLAAAISAGDLQSAAKKCGNVFERALPKSQRETITAIKEALVANGAYSAAMTGTGSAVFGIFKDQAAALLMSKALPDGVETFLCRPERIVRV